MYQKCAFLQKAININLNLTHIQYHVLMRKDEAIRTKEPVVTTLPIFREVKIKKKTQMRKCINTYFLMGFSNKELNLIKHIILTTSKGHKFRNIYIDLVVQTL